MAEFVDLEVPALQILRTDGPMPLGELRRRLDGAGHLGHLREEAEDDAHLERLLLDELLSDDTWITPGDVITDTDRLLEGLTLTHRLTAEELERDEVDVVPDLVILDWGVHAEGLSIDGDPARRLRTHAGEALAGPPGWLEGFAAGDLLAFTRRGTSVVIEPASLDDDARELQLLAATVDPRIRPGEGEEAVPLLLDALTADHTAFTTAARPVGELLEAIGLERRGFQFGRSGERWSTLSRSGLLGIMRQAAGRYGLDFCCQEAFHRAVDALLGIEAIPAVDGPAVARALGHGAVVWAVAEVVFPAGRDQPVPTPDELARQLRGRAEAAPVLTLLAILAERKGRADEAEALLRDARRADPDYGPAACELAEHEIDHGHVDRAIALLEQSGTDYTEANLERLRAYRELVVAPFRGVGRNDRCPCGSGRKFKACCDRNPTVALSLRARLLQFKAATFAARPHRRSGLIGLASSAIDPDDPDLAMSLGNRASDPVIFDLYVFEGGAGLEYLDERGHRLPEDERDLFERLLEEPRRLWEVTEVRPGTGLTLRDSGRGDEVELAEVRGSTKLAVGEHVLGRVVAVDDAHLMLGQVLLVPLWARAAAIELVDSRPDADAFARWYGRLVASSTDRRRDGYPLMFRRARLLTDASDAELAEALDGVFEDDGVRWVDLDGDGVVLATITLTDDGPVVEAISDRRLDLLSDRIRAVLPSAVLEELELDDDDFDDDDDDELEFGLSAGYFKEEQDPPIVCRAELVTDAAESDLRTALGSVLEPDGDEDWVDVDEAGDLICHVWHGEDIWVVESASVARHEWLVDQLEQRLPGIRFVELDEDFEEVGPPSPALLRVSPEIDRSFEEG